MLGTLWSAALSKRDCDTVSQFFCEYCEICKNTFFTEHFQWLLLPWSRVAECLVFDTTTVQSYKIHRSALKPDVTFTKLLWPEVTLHRKQRDWFDSWLNLSSIKNFCRIVASKEPNQHILVIFLSFSVFSDLFIIWCYAAQSGLPTEKKMPLPTNLVAAVPENEMLLFCGGEHSKVKTRIKRKNIDTAV